MAFKNPHFQLICFALVFLIFALFVSPTLARPLAHPKLSSRESHELWMAQHGRVYKDDVEKEKRYNIFKENAEYIKSFNNGNTSSNKFFKLGVNAFSDLTTEEFIATHTGYKRQFGSMKKGNKHTYTYANLTDVDTPPPSVDWRDQGAVTPIKNQGSCECCWAFSTVAAVEGLNQINTGRLISLSEQELLDCVKNNSGCKGGSLENAFAFMKQNQGLVAADQYGYKGQQGQCQVPSGGQASTVQGYQRVPQHDEAALMQAVARQPVTVSITASGEFKSYKSGVFNGQCGNTVHDLNHAVAVIGYGTDTDGTNYWLLKNSWGATWGENGFMRIIRDQNQCGLSLDTLYPI